MIREVFQHAKQVECVVSVREDIKNEGGFCWEMIIILSLSCCSWMGKNTQWIIWETFDNFQIILLNWIRNLKNANGNLWFCFKLFLTPMFRTEKKLSSGVITEYNYLWYLWQLALSLLVRVHVQCLWDNWAVLFAIAKILEATKMPFHKWMDN